VPSESISTRLSRPDPLSSTSDDHLSKPAPTSSAATAAVEMRGITKRFGDVVANDHIDLTVETGEVHALLGENGAGKTTLMRILYGLTPLDEGSIRVGGIEREIRSPKDAIAVGVGMVTQHFSLVEPMTVAENLALGKDGFRYDESAARERVTVAAEQLGARVDPDARVQALSVGEQQRVEILKALARNCRVLVLDEPTAVLAPPEIESLFETVRRLTAEGLSIVFISHKLTEVMAITDRITVLRRGVAAGTVPRADTDERELARMMVGRLPAGLRSNDAEPGRVLLSVTNVSAAGDRGLKPLDDVTLEVRAGEILGIAGVSGNGQSQLAEVLSGMRTPSAGTIAVDGRDLTNSSPERMVRAGVGRIPEDRHASLIGDMSVAYNLAMEHFGAFRKGPIVDERAIRRHAEELIRRFDIRARPADRIRTLSGGNIQKVLLARVLAGDPKVIVAAQPTRGLDVGATEYVRSQLLKARDDGTAIVLISEDLDEILALADKVAVMYEGTMSDPIDRDRADTEHIGLLMAGKSQT
jgi:general nucleoside transport system ATP-binding protein